MTSLKGSKEIELLMAPFPDDAVSLKPIYTGEYEPDAFSGEMRIPKDAYRKCKVCGKWHNLPAKHLSYVGHARITERLCEVDPYWTWEPLATDDDGLPVIKGGCLWIRLKVLGVSRIGVGDAGGKGGPNAIKEMIGDAIRNAAMRFGCGIEMWYGDASEDSEPVQTPPNPQQHDSEAVFTADVGPKATKYQKELSEALKSREEALGDGAEIVRFINKEFGRDWRRFNQMECEAALEMVGDYACPDSIPVDDDEEVIPV